MKKLFVLVLCLTLLTCFSGASPILTEKQAKQLLRSRRQDRPSKPGFPDEPMRARAPRTYYARDTSNGNSVANGQSTRIPRGLPDATPEPDVRALCPEYMHHLLRLEHRAEEQFLEHWLNPHCKPHCDRNVVHPV